MKITVYKTFTFDSAHFLPNYIGPCANLHGHTYKLEIGVQGKVQANGMIMDFTKLKSIVQDTIISKYDHTLLNDSFQIPTAEVMVSQIFILLNLAFKKHNVLVVCVRLWETPTSYAEITNS